MNDAKGLITENIGDGRCRVFIPLVHSPNMLSDIKLRKYLPIAEPATPLMGLGGQNTSTGFAANPIPGSWVWISFIEDDINRPLYHAQAGIGPFLDSYKKLAGENNLENGGLSNETCDSDPTDQVSGEFSNAQNSGEWENDFYGAGMVAFKPTPSFEQLNMMGVNGGWTRETAFGSISKNSFDYQLRSMNQPGDTALSVDTGWVLRNAALASSYLDKSVRPYSSTDPSYIIYLGDRYNFSEETDCYFSYKKAEQPSLDASGNEITLGLVYYLKDPSQSELPPPKIQEVVETCNDIDSPQLSGVTTTSLSTEPCGTAYKAGKWYYRIAITNTDSDVNTSDETYVSGADLYLVRPGISQNCDPSVCSIPNPSIIYAEETFTWTGITDDNGGFIYNSTTSDMQLTFKDGIWSDIGGGTVLTSDITCVPSTASEVKIIPDSAVDNKYLANQYGILNSEYKLSYDKTLTFTPLIDADPERHYVTFVIEPMPIFDDETPTTIEFPTINDMKCDTKQTLDTYNAFGKNSGPSPSEAGLNNPWLNLSWNYSIMVKWDNRQLPTECNPTSSQISGVDVISPQVVSLDDKDWTYSNTIFLAADDIIYVYKNGTQTLEYHNNLSSWNLTGSEDKVFPYCMTTAEKIEYSYNQKYDISKEGMRGAPIIVTIPMCQFKNSNQFKIEFECNSLTNADGKKRKICAGYAANKNVASFFGCPIVRVFEYTSISMLENNLWRMGMNIDFNETPENMTAQLKAFFEKMNNGSTYNPYIPREVATAEISNGSKLIAAPELILHGDRVIVIDADMIILNAGRLCLNAESIGILSKDYNVVSSSMPVWKNMDNSNTNSNLGTDNI